VATPIGNLGDITLRALEVLRALHQHNERHAAQRVLALLEQGRAVALAADAGTPGVSDPGAMLVQAARSHAVAVIAIPGPSALAAAWSVSGFSGPFLFQGFLPARAAERRKSLAALADLPCALVFYEAPHRILETARDLATVLGGSRQAIVARELTKVFESVHGCVLSELAAWIESDPNRQRGEIVLIVSGAVHAVPQDALAKDALRVLLEELAPAQAARLAARIAGVPRGPLYQLAVELRGKHDRPD
jgi:16S rRNA (cytidine1402-2'-O)-methyltransferase